MLHKRKTNLMKNKLMKRYKLTFFFKRHRISLDLSENAWMFSNNIRICIIDKIKWTVLMRSIFWWHKVFLNIIMYIPRTLHGTNKYTI